MCFNSRLLKISFNSSRTNYLKLCLHSLKNLFIVNYSFLYLILLRIPPNRYLSYSGMFSTPQFFWESFPDLSLSSLSKTAANSLLKMLRRGDTSEAHSEDDDYSIMISGGMWRVNPKDFFISSYFYLWELGLIAVFVLRCSGISDFVSLTSSLSFFSVE